MSYYIAIHEGFVQDDPESNWINISFTFKEHSHLRTDGALISCIIERIREQKFKLSKEPWDRTRRWCISLPVSPDHRNLDTIAADAQQLAEWYKVQILNGNASINRELLFDLKPFHAGKECCRDNVCDRMLHPEWYKEPEEQA